MVKRKINKKKKIRMYKTAISSTVLFSAETKQIANRDTEKLKVFEINIKRRIRGLKKISEKQYRKLMNQEIKEQLEGDYIVKEIKSRWLRQYGHINKEEEETVTKR